MSKKINGTTRDIESILADIRVQAQRRARLAHTINPSLAEEHVNGGDQQHAAVSGLAYAYQQRGAAAKQRQPDLPVILLKTGVTPKVARSTPTPTSVGNGNGDASVRPLSSALRNLRHSLEQGPVKDKSDEGKRSSRPKTTTPTEIVGKEAVAPQAAPSNDNVNVSEGPARLSALQQRSEAKQVVSGPTIPTTPPFTPAPSGATLPQPNPSQFQPAVSSEPVHPSSSPREMASFMDTRMSRMVGPNDGIGQQAAIPAAKEVRPPQASAVVNAPPPQPATPPKNTTTAPVDANATQGASEGIDGVHDVAAELLRPMLKDWVGENMPQIVQKALQLEHLEGVKKDKKS